MSIERPLHLTDSELDLIYTEFNVSIECGAEDLGFVVIRDKIQNERIRRAIAKERKKK